MKSHRAIALCAALLLSAGCHQPKYGTEEPLTIDARLKPVWAIAPAINLSGQVQVDPLLQADLLYQQLQAVKGITVVPVDRVVQVYAALGISKVESPEQAAVVCEQLGCDGLLVPTITQYDPYNPPKFGAALHLLLRTNIQTPHVDPRDLVRQATPGEFEPLAVRPNFVQSVGMFDAANGSVRAAVLTYAKGRNDPLGPLGSKEYFVSMDRYCGFVYHALIADLIRQTAPAPRNVEVQAKAVVPAVSVHHEAN